jgi:purine-binding chemotaxis protein CheW
VKLHWLLAGVIDGDYIEQVLVMSDKNDKSVSQQKSVEPLHSAGGKFLTFRLGAEEYGIEIIKVREIIGLINITSVPKTPYFVRGIMKLRGRVISVVDLRLKFDMEAAEDTDETCIIVADIRSSEGSVLIGVLVDSVSEVLDINGADIEAAPTINGGFDSRFILGMGKVNNDVKILLNIDQVLTDEDMSMISGLGMDEGSSGDDKESMFVDEEAENSQSEKKSAV